MLVSVCGLCIVIDLLRTINVVCKVRQSRLRSFIDTARPPGTKNRTPQISFDFSFFLARRRFRLMVSLIPVGLRHNLFICLLFALNSRCWNARQIVVTLNLKQRIDESHLIRFVQTRPQSIPKPSRKALWAVHPSESVPTTTSGQIGRLLLR